MSALNISYYTFQESANRNLYFYHHRRSPARLLFHLNRHDYRTESPKADHHHRTSLCDLSLFRTYLHLLLSDHSLSFVCINRRTRFSYLPQKPLFFPALAPGDQVSFGHLKKTKHNDHEKNVFHIRRQESQANTYDKAAVGNSAAVPVVRPCLEEIHIVIFFHRRPDKSPYHEDHSHRSPDQ